MAKRKIIGVKIRYWDDFSGGVVVVRDKRDDDERQYLTYRSLPKRPIANRLERAQSMQRALFWSAVDEN